jgi:hypothetical protein
MAFYQSIIDSTLKKYMIREVQKLIANETIKKQFSPK